MKYKIFGFLSVVTLSLCAVFALTDSANAAACHQIRNVNQMPVTEHYSPPVSPVNNEIMLRADCADGATLQVGINNNQTLIYSRGYVLESSNWVPVTLSGNNNPQSNEWIVGPATANIAKNRLKQNDNNYYVAYTCIYNENRWKCGCKDSVCTNNFWQLQSFRLSGTGNGGSDQNNQDNNNNTDADLSTPLFEPIEFELKNPSISGNPFDLIANVYFTHQGSNERIKTQMFFDENNTWKFRFTGTKTGIWNYTTESKDPELNDKKGSINVSGQMNKLGFITHRGNKFVRQTDEKKVKGYIHNVFMNYHKKYDLETNPTEQTIRQYIAEARQNGCNTIFAGYVAHRWHNYDRIDRNARNPDPKTFRILERMINVAHQEDSAVYIWAWRDQSRDGGSPTQFGGINSESDKRLQRYIAARLGPLPGWSMGYGFDLHEWTKPNQLEEWATYLHQNFGWDHMLSTRGHKLKNSRNNMISYDGFGRRGVEIKTTEGGPQNYQEVVEDIDSDKSQVHFYEERHSYRRPKFNLDMDGSRRLMWWETMAGGMGGFFGFYAFDWSPYPYPNPEQLNAHHKFWTENNRFLVDFERANNLTNGAALKSKNNQNYVFYAENTNSIQMNLSGMNGAKRAIAIDTKQHYREIDLGTLQAQNQTWNAPRRSDWAIAVGDF